MHPKSTLLLFFTIFSSLNALATIQRAGRYLYNTTDGSRFYIKGVAYQPQGWPHGPTLEILIYVVLGTVGADAANPFPEPTECVAHMYSQTRTQSIAALLILSVMLPAASATCLFYSNLV
jgi:hypothetical protein